MNNSLNIFTSESVSEGHPDKICDQISDNILDAVLELDRDARVACETFITTQRVIVGGEIKTNAKVNYESIVRETLRKIGYTHESIGINCDTCVVDILLHEQSSDIAQGVDKKGDIGAGDQGIMFGFATNETKQYMPLAITIAHELVNRASKLRKSGDFKFARPDMKSQVTIEYGKTNKVNTVLMSIQHDDDYNEFEFKTYVKQLIRDVLNGFDVDCSDYDVLINPTGRFVIGGPDGDAGLTGRKIIVDTYGGYARHGGGAFSGKDATKVDRSAAYMARYIAKNVVAAQLCDKCEIQLSYAIGMSDPISVLVDTFSTNKIDEQLIVDVVLKTFDMRPSQIIKHLDLTKPIFKNTSAYGHMGRTDFEFNWEKLDMVDKIKSSLLK